MSSSTWYGVNAARERLGPMTAEELRARFESGELQRRSLVWQTGMPQWQPLEQVADALGIVLAPMAAPPAAPDIPAIAATDRVSAAAEAPPPPATEAALAQAYAASSRDASAIGRHDVDDVVDAGFVRRFAAYIIDAVLLTIAMYAIIILLLIVFGFGITGLMTMFESSATGGAPEGPILFIVIFGFYVLPFLMQGTYHIIFTGSAWQASPGKRLLGIKVVDFDGQRITYGRSTGRWFAAALSYLTFYIGFLMAAFTDRKLALHDLVASTRVVDQWAYTDHPERQQRGVGGCAIAALVGGLLLFGAIMAGVIAAISLPAYQDYAERSRLSEVMMERYGMQSAIEAFRDNTDRCPASLDEAGLTAPASPLVLDTALGEVGPGQCSVRFTLGGPNAGELDGEYLWFTLGEDGAWACGGSMDDALLPLDCRG